MLLDRARSLLGCVYICTVCVSEAMTLINMYDKLINAYVYRRPDRNFGGENGLHV